jgi:hypothetical protein
MHSNENTAVHNALLSLPHYTTFVNTNDSIKPEPLRPVIHITHPF